MIASLAGTLTSLAISMAPNAFAMSEIVVWLMGALTDRSWPDVAVAAPLSLAGIGVLLLAGRGLDALTLGEQAARSLGVNLARLRWMLVVVLIGAVLTGLVPQLPLGQHHEPSVGE